MGLKFEKCFSNKIIFTELGKKIANMNDLFHIESKMCFLKLPIREISMIFIINLILF